MVLPLGAHSGEPSLNGPLVICLGAPPSALTTKMCTCPEGTSPPPSRRETNDSVYRVAGPQSAPSGFAGNVTNDFGGSGTNIVNAIALPSGDHFSDEGLRSTCVITPSTPEASHRT